MKLEIAARAKKEIERKARWWADNRKAAPLWLAQEIERALDFIKATPFLGPVYAARKSRIVRRVLLPRTQHHLYYRRDGRDLIRVLALWSARREHGPKL